MSMKIIKGTVIGGIAYFFTGWLVWGILMAGVMENMYDAALNRPGNEMIWWAMIASNLVFALLITLMLKLYGAKNATDGLKIGALVGVLFALAADLGIYSMTTMIHSIMGVLLDAIVYTVVSALIGLVIVLTWGKDKSA